MVSEVPVLKHAKDREQKDWSLIAFDLLSLSYLILQEGKDSDNYRYVQPLADAAGLCFEVSSLSKTMEDLYRRIESI